MSTISETVIDQLSIRIDEHSDEILRLRERTHEMETTIPAIVSSVDKNADQIMSIFEKQKSFDGRIVQEHEKLLTRISEVEKVTNGIRLVATHWKSLIIVAILFAVLGFTFEKGIKDIVVALLPDKAVKAAQVIANG